MKTSKYLAFAGLAAASLFASQAFGAACPNAPVGGAVTKGSPTCVATTSPDGGGTGDSLSELFGPGGSQVTGTGLDIYNGQYTPSSEWQIGATQGSENTLVMEIAGNANLNSFGIYDPTDISKTLQLFSGPDGTSSSATLKYFGGGKFGAAAFGGTATFANFGDGATFGYYLNTPNGVFYSNPFLNQDPDSAYTGGTPHMVAYQGGNGTSIKVGGVSGQFLSNEYLLGWEDQAFKNSDLDYNDFIVLVESVHSVPEPGVLGMFGLGALLIGFGVSRRRRENV